MIAAGADPMPPEAELREAQAIIADLTHHPESAVIAACRTVLRLSRSEEQFQEAFAILRTLDRLELIP